MSASLVTTRIMESENREGGPMPARLREDGPVQPVAPVARAVILQWRVVHGASAALFDQEDGLACGLVHDPKLDVVGHCATSFSLSSAASAASMLAMRSAISSPSCFSAASSRPSSVFA